MAFFLIICLVFVIYKIVCSSLSQHQQHQKKRYIQQISLSSSRLTALCGDTVCPSWVKFVGKHLRHHFPSRYLGQPSVNRHISFYE